MTFRRTRCPHCKAKLDQGQRIHAECIEPYADAEEAKAKRKAEKQARMQARVEKAEDRKRREQQKTIPVLIAETQKVFNAYIRERDRLARHNCISSGRQLDWSGNAVDAGHYRSTGAASHLRFNEDNCHAQSKHDNQFLAGNAVDYRLGLIARIGLTRVEALEADNTPHKWTHDELRAIKATYTQKLKDLRKGNQ